MAHIIADRVKETSTTTGTGNLTLLGAVAQFRALSAVLANNDTSYYAAVGQSGTEWEVGLCTFVSATPAIARTTVFASSNAGALVNFSAGTKDIFLTAAAGRITMLDHELKEILPHSASQSAAPASTLGMYSVNDGGVTRLEYITSDGQTVRIARDQILTVRNNTGAVINKGEWVYVSGANANLIRVTKAQANAESTAPAIGVMMENVSTGTDGRCMVGGILTGISTTGMTEGDRLFLSAATAGLHTTTAPVFPNILQRLAFVLNVHASNGTILVAPVDTKHEELSGSKYVAIADPAASPASTLYVYSRLVAGRALPKWKGPSGLDTPFQPALFGKNIVLYMPNTGTTNGLNLGTPWSGLGTISHPTPTSTNAATQMQRTRYANVVTTTNQVLGVSSIVSTAHSFWRGNAANLGGFFFFARFLIELWPATTVRLFAGLQDGTTNILASDTVAGNVVGLWHDTTDGANVASLVTRNNTTTTKNALGGTAPTLAANQGFDFYLFCAPNGGTIFYRLDDLNANVTLVDSSHTTTLPLATAFMGPVVGMSNGTANITVTTTAPGVNRIYVESDR